jgi:high-affinity iron transporter
MATALLIMVREGFEAALIVAILAVYLRRIERLDLRRDMWRGVAAAVAVAVAAGAAIHQTVGDLAGAARLRSFAAISVFAAAVLTWMVFWMGRHARGISGELRQKIDRALHAGNVRAAVFAVAFLAVVREGLEAALFLVATATTDSGFNVVVGALVGIAIAVALGVAVNVFGRRLPMRAFFRVTGMVIIVFAAGLLSRTVMFLQSAGDLGSADLAVYDLTSHAWLTTSTEVGKFLGALVGWDPRPSLEQIVVWLAYALPVSAVFLRGTRASSQAPTPAAPTPPAPAAASAAQPARAESAEQRAATRP